MIKWNHANTFLFLKELKERYPNVVSHRSPHNTTLGEGCFIVTSDGNALLLDSVFSALNWQESWDGMSISKMWLSIVDDEYFEVEVMKG